MNEVSNAIYKVLDVREFNEFHLDGLKDTKQYIIVICENSKTKERRRFEIQREYEYKRIFMDKTKYCGYTGDFELLVKGDYFEIKENDGHKKVVIVHPDTIY